MIVPLDTPVATRAENFRKVLDFDESAAYRALQETKQVYPEAEVPPLRPPRLKREGRSLVALVRGRRAMRPSAWRSRNWAGSATSSTRPRPRS